MFCSHCGQAVNGTAHFCSNCGAPVASATFSASSAPPPGYPRGTLVRPRHPRMIAGVCSGIAEHYGWDVTLIRIVLVVSIFTVGVGLGLYLILWIVIPEAPYALPQPVGQPGSPIV